MTGSTRARVLPVAGAGLAVGALVSLGTLPAAMVAGCVAVSVLLYFQTLLVPLLILSSALSRLSVNSAGTDLRADLAFVLVAALAIANSVLVRVRSGRLARTPLTVPLMAYLGCNVLSTLGFASEKSRGLKLDAQIAAVLLCVAVVGSLLAGRADFSRAIAVIWIVTTIEAGLGIGFVALSLAHVTSLGVQSGDYGLPMAYGTSYEANIFGSFLAGNFFVLLADYTLNRRGPRYVLPLVVVLVALAASETRSAWVGLLVGVLLFLLLLSRGQRDARSLVPVLAGLPVLAAVAGLLGTATPLASRLLGLVNLHSSSAAGRLVIFRAAFADWQTHPLFGLGTGSFNFGSAPGQPHPWLPNLFLLTLHDTGLVGFAALLWIIARFYRSSLAAVKLGGDAEVCAVGAICGITALLVSFQTTSGFWFAYPWILFTLGSCAARAHDPAA